MSSFPVPQTELKVLAPGGDDRQAQEVLEKVGSVQRYVRYLLLNQTECYYEAARQ